MLEVVREVGRAEEAEIRLRALAPLGARGWVDRERRALGFDLALELGGEVGEAGKEVAAVHADGPVRAGATLVAPSRPEAASWT